MLLNWRFSQSAKQDKWGQRGNECHSPRWRPRVRPQPTPRPRGTPKTACSSGAALTCGVPYGDVEGTPLLQVEGAAHGADRVWEATLHVALQQRRFTHVHVPQQHDLPIRLPHSGGGGGPCASRSPAQDARGRGSRPPGTPNSSGPGLRSKLAEVPKRKRAKAQYPSVNSALGPRGMSGHHAHPTPPGPPRPRPQSSPKPLPHSLKPLPRPYSSLSLLPQFPFLCR